MKNYRTKSVEMLINAMAKFKSPDEIYAFLDDLCTIKEIQDMAQRFETAILLAEGKDLDCDTTINDGSYDVKYLELKPVAVTRDNIDSNKAKDSRLYSTNGSRCPYARNPILRFKKSNACKCSFHI